MLIGILKIKNNNYYIYLNNDVISVIHTNNRNINYLNSKEIKELFKFISSSRLTYKEKYNDYDIYLDEANNKRYFKDGIEDYNLFFNNNGINAIEYSDSKTNNKSNFKNSKKYRIIVGALTVEIVAVSTCLALILGTELIRYKSDIGDRILSFQEINENELEELIMNSERLSEEDREFLINEELLNLVLATAENNRNYSLRDKLEDLEIIFFDSNAQKGHRSGGGFYDPLTPNRIYICNDITPNSIDYYNVLSHEFIHLLQENNNYFYINEACAEIMSTEYFNQIPDGYKDLVRRVKVLMEIIGPGPVIDCNFKGDTTSFENAIGQYLNEEDKTRLLQLFSIPSTTMTSPEFDLNSLNTEIDNLLATMYYNKTGNDISYDNMINLIYNGWAYERIYFNSSLPEYANDYQLPSQRVILDTSDFYEVLESNQIENFTWFHPEIIESNQGPITTYTTTTTNDYSTITPETNSWMNLTFRDGTLGTVSYDATTNRWGSVEHYQIVDCYEPSIASKFPDQVSNKNSNKNETKTM